jgi:hypothetical protein
MPEITYIGAHQRVWRAKGKAVNYRCVKCSGPAADWAYTHDNPCPNEWVSPQGYKYSGDIKRYQPMCHPCHVRYDGAERTHCPQGHEYAGDNLYFEGATKRCKTCVYKRNNDRRKKFGMTAEQKERKLQLQRERRAAIRELAA